MSALANAQQIPLLDQVKGWFGQASSAVSSFIPNPSAPSIPNPAKVGAAAVASSVVDRLTLDNFRTLLIPGAATASPGIEEWMVFVTGENKTCYGLCTHAETEWNKSVPVLAASKSPPHLAVLNCETDGVLCNAWALGPPALIHMLLPQPQADQSQPPSTVRSIPLNRTHVTYLEIAAVHTEKGYEKIDPYEGFFHPFDGPLAKSGLMIPVGYAIWAVSQVPSWVFMIGISFFSRHIMQRRMQRPEARPQQTPAQ